jgi:hypothetical protein
VKTSKHSKETSSGSELEEDVFDFGVGQGGGHFHRGIARGTGELREVLDVVDAGEQLAEFC